MGVGTSGPDASSSDIGVNLEFKEEVALIRSGEATHVELGGQMLGPLEIEELCEALACTASVKALELDSNAIGDEGAANLAETLARGEGLNFVDLTDNGIGDAGATALASRLGGNCALHHLDLTGNEIKCGGGLALGRMLTVNSGIRQLTLCENMLGAEGARAIGMALPCNLSLRILNLRNCGLGPEGARLIAQGLNSNHAALTELSVGLNEVGDDGAAGFAEMIRMNRSVREFYAESNGIRSFGAGLIAEALMHNDCLRKLWMVDNALEVDVVAKFAHAVNQNKVLLVLGITSEKALPQGVLGEMDGASEKRRRIAESSRHLADDLGIGNDEPLLLRRKMCGATRHLFGSGGSRFSRSRSPVQRVLIDDPIDLENDERPLAPRKMRGATRPLFGGGGSRSSRSPSPVERVTIERVAPQVPSPVEGRSAAQHIVMLDDDLQFEELLQIVSEYRIHGAGHAPPVDLAEDPPRTPVSEDSYVMEA